MLTRTVLAVTIAIASIAVPAFAGKKPAHHKRHYGSAHGKTCKKEFMFMKGNKCVDARKAKG